MYALVYTDTQKIIYREEKNPKHVNGESIIKVSTSGICGSEWYMCCTKNSFINLMQQ